MDAEKVGENSGDENADVEGREEDGVVVSEEGSGAPSLNWEKWELFGAEMDSN